MELFTLGIGHYRESDVKEAARALTGWTVDDGQFREVAPRHDEGIKSILGHSGKLKGDDLVRVLQEHPATSRRLAGRICGWLMGEGAVSEAAVSALADGLRAHDLDIGWAVATVLRSRTFWDRKNLRSRVLGPVEMVAGSLRALELLEPPPSTLVVADWASRLGQDLFYPPNVGGWPGGRAWLSSRTLIGRANFAEAVVQGHGIGRAEPLDALWGWRASTGSRRTARPSSGSSPNCCLVAHRGLTGSISSTARWSTASAWGPAVARRAVAFILASPEGQVA